MVVNPSAKQLGEVVETVGVAGAIKPIRFVNAVEGTEVQLPLVAVTVYAVPIIAPDIAPPTPVVGPNGENV